MIQFGRQDINQDDIYALLAFLPLDFLKQGPAFENTAGSFYQHTPEVKSYKMDYRILFDWYSDFACMTHKVRHHSELGYTDVQDEWVAVSTLRKYHKD